MKPSHRDRESASSARISRCRGRIPFAVRLLSLALALPLGASAVLSDAGPGGPRPVSEVQVQTLAPVDVRALLIEDRAMGDGRVGDIPYRVGFPVSTDLSPASSGTWDTLAGGDRLWRLEVHSPEALWLVLGFGTYRLPPGAWLTVYDPSRSTVLGPYTDADVRPHGQLWTPPVDGDTLVVELLWSAALQDEVPRLHLGTVTHGYKRPWGDDPLVPVLEPGTDEPVFAPDASGSCNIDVNCPLGADWQNEKRGVVRILTGPYLCTASLINTTANDCTPYVLTARHCVSTASGAAGTTFLFGYERPSCASGVAPTNMTLTGSSLVATYLASDFTLLRMDDDPPLEFAPFWSGWSRSTAPAPEAWCIHHPSGDVKKISYNEDPLVDGQSSGYGPDHWRVTEWEQGTTEGGSSGSPLYDPDHRIVGQLHGGYASCTAITWDEYGKLDVSWNGGGTPTSRLKDWLDPTGSGVLGVDGVDLTVCLAAPELSVAAWVVDDALGNHDGHADPGEGLTLDVHLRNTGNAEATGLQATLSSTDPLVAVSRASASFSDAVEGAVVGSNDPHFGVSVDPAWPCGQRLPLRLVVTTAETGPPFVLDVKVPTGTPGPPVTRFADDMEAGPGGWTAVPLSSGLLWALTDTDSSSPTHSWHVKDLALSVDTTLVSPVVADLPQDSVLRFRHRFDTENNRDGGVLEYSTTGGSSWLDAGALFLSGGYNSGIGIGTVSPLAGRSAWAGDSGGWTSTEVDLSSLAGSDLSLRWRFASNASIADAGWFVDDVTIETPTYSCVARTLVPGEASDPDAGSAPFTIDRHAAGGYELGWSEPTAGGAATSYRLYRAALGQESLAPECETALGAATAATVPTLPANSAFLVVGVNSIGEGSYGEDSVGAPRPAGDANECP